MITHRARVGIGDGVRVGRARAAVVAAGLTKRYGSRLAVDAVDFELPGGVVSGFVGPNGAGKTTTVGMLVGLIRPTGGTAEVLGHSVSRPAAYLSRVGALIEAPAFYPTLSGRRNLEVLTRLSRLDRARIAEVLELVGLSDRGDDLVRSYSLGMKQRLGVAAALLPAPELVILDEPANGLDPAGMREIRSLLRTLADHSTTVFVSSHMLAEVQAICDYLVMIDKGRIVFQGAIDDLLAAQRSELVAIPEHVADLARLLEVCAAGGYPARIDRDAVRVQASGSWAAELNRRAMGAGITLRGLRSIRASLEEAYFSITDQAEDPRP
ncbi:MAG TPA: ABC transporter ATP-binding protein [Solirubrobacteraceae bacterium]|nr:ABC transporter ATP-binding protein [Solirubrobacteraceae bacterium]